MREKTSSVAGASALVDFNIHKVKSKIIQYSTICTIRVTLDGEDLEDVKSLTYLGSIIDEYSGSDAHMKAQMGKVRAAYLQVKNIWNSKQLSTNTKVVDFIMVQFLVSSGKTLSNHHLNMKTGRIPSEQLPRDAV
ncbi:unnamed protein product [Schistosoma margrebowiei]|uniref:Uncharacterized protein n=1 Tax=Schistosoma margrebowiei TaxID=48269 RepID=A0A183LCZ8_9TREM|nr:unnamed protein product [Schistosoma margrebowiei]